MKITICGSMKFRMAFEDWNAILTLGGHTVYGHCILAPTDTEDLRWHERKRRLDLVHLDKISESDAIVVLNPGGYIGESTLREIEWAQMRRKDIYYLENRPLGQGILGGSVWTLQNLFEHKPIDSIPEAKAYEP